MKEKFHTLPVSKSPNIISFKLPLLPNILLIFAVYLVFIPLISIVPNFDAIGLLGVTWNISSANVPRKI